MTKYRAFKICRIWDPLFLYFRAKINESEKIVWSWMERDDTCGLLSTINVPYLFEFVRGHIVGRPVLRHDSEIARRDRNAMHFERTPMLTNVSIQIVQICINKRLESSSNQTNNLNDTSKNMTAEQKHQSHEEER